MKMTCQGCGVEIEGERPELKPSADLDTFLTVLIALCHPCFERAQKRIRLMTHARSN